MIFQILDILVRFQTSSELRTFIRLIGRNEQGERVCADIYGIPWYVFVDRWEDHWTGLLDDRMVRSASRGRGQCKCISCKGVKMGRNQPCKQVQMRLLDKVIEKVEPVQKKSFCGYSPVPRTYYKITLTQSFLMRPITWSAESMLEDENLQWFETDISPEIRFCTDYNITPSGWVKIQGDEIRTELRVAHHYKVDLKRDQRIIPLDISKNSAIVTLAWDIECTCMTGEERFPIASEDPVITIGCVRSVYGKPELTTKTVFQLDTCDAIEGTKVVACATEESLLEKFCEYFVETGPDIFSGYNSDAFDFVYVFERMERLKLKHMKFISIEPRTQVFFKKGTSQSAQSGARETIKIFIPGTVAFDLLPICRMGYKLRSYTLNNVAKHFLKDQEKDEMRYQDLPVFQKKDSKHRQLIARYCIQDVVLVQLLCDKLQLLTNALAMSQVCGVSLNAVISRGQSHKTKTMILKETFTKGFIFPVFPKDPATGYTVCRWHNGVVNAQAFETGKGKASFKGATVLNAMAGFYKDPVVVLDFASLYPSVMRSFNLSQDQMVQSYKQAAKMGLKKEEINESPNGFLFCNKSPGILPTILERLLVQRKAAKKRMKDAPNDFEKAVYDGQQLALKVGMNSIYGWCGASFGAVPAPNIASSVTAYGRQMIDSTAAWAEREYPGTKIIYGDTDSVFVLFPPVPGETPLEARERAWAMAGDMEERINKDGTFKSPNFLEREKAYSPFYLLSKKRYAGMKYVDDMTKGKQDFTGLEIVRRDNCKLLKHTQEQFFEQLLQNISPNGAAKSLLNNIKELMTGKVPLDMLTISKKLAKAKYAGNQVHVSLNERIRERTPALAYSVGSRIPYVVIAGHGQLYERGEDVQFVKDNFLAIDYQYYLAKQLVQPMTRLLEPLFGRKHTKLFFERAQNGAIHSHFKSNKEDWIPPLLGDEVEEPKKKKRKKPPQKNNLTNYFSKKSKQ